MKAVFKSKKRLEDAKGSDSKEPRVEELVDLLALTPGKWVQMRLVGPVASYGLHWIPASVAEAAEIKAGKKGKAKRFPQVCLAFDPETEEVDSTKHCPWCDAESEHIQKSTDYYQNVIVRELQEDEPKKKGKPTKNEEKTGMKEKGSAVWTPVRVLRLNGGLIRDLKRLGALNRHKDKKTGEKKPYSLSHDKYGKDIMVMWDPDEKTPSKRTTVTLSDHTPLTAEEQEYLVWNIENLQHPKKPADAKEEYKRWAKRNEQGLPKKGKKKDEDEDEDLDDEDDVDGDDDDDEDDAPKKGKGKSKGKPAKGKKGKSKDDDDDEDDDEDEDLDDEDDLDEDDDDEDDEPKSKKGKGKKPVKGKKSKDEDDEDDDDEDEDLDDDDEDEDSDDDEDEDEDDKPKKGKKSKGKEAKKPVKGKGKKSSKDDDDDEDEDEDEDDEDLDDDDDEDEDEKPKKGKGKGKKPSKDEDDEDDDIDDDDLDDDDDEDEKPAKKGKGKKPVKKAKKSGKKKKKDDDEDDDD